MSALFRTADRMTGVESSPTVRLNAMAQELIRQGKDIVNLTAGETDFETPQNIRQAAIDAMNRGMTRYTAPHGIPELRKAVSDWFKRDFGLSYETKQVTVTCGVKQGIFNLILATVGPGDEVLIPAPYWVSYPEMVRLAGGVPVIVPYQGDFDIDVDELKKKLSPRSRLLLLNSPNNPTGAMYSDASLRAIAKMLEGTDVLVASDEIYSALCYDGREFRAFASFSKDAYERTITFNGLSKSHAMTGWRVGFAAGNVSVIDSMGILQAQSATNITSFVQAASIEALKQTKEEFAPRLKDMQERRDFCLDLLKPLKDIRLPVPRGAFYLFPDVSRYFGKRFGKYEIRGSESMAEYLLKEAGIAIVPGKPFGEDRCIRFSFAKDKAYLEKGMTRFVAALQKL